MLDKETIDALDPNIRKLVCLLNSWGYQTTDSGDGMTKVEGLGWDDIVARGLITSPHVVISPVSDVHKAIELHNRLVGYIKPDFRNQLNVEFSYSTKSKHGLMIVFDICDCNLL